MTYNDPLTERLLSFKLRKNCSFLLFGYNTSNVIVVNNGNNLIGLELAFLCNWQLSGVRILRCGSHSLHHFLGNSTWLQKCISTNFPTYWAASRWKPCFCWLSFSARRPLVSSIFVWGKQRYKVFGVECIRKTPQRPTRADATILVAC